MKNKIQSDFVAAMKAGNKQLAETLKAVKAAITTKEKENGSSVSDGDVLAIISKMVKDRKGANEQFQQAVEKGQSVENSKKLIAQNEADILILEQYLPKQISTDELTALVKEIISSNSFGKSDMGKVIKAVKEKHSTVDGKLLSEIVKANL